MLRRLLEYFILYRVKTVSSIEYIVSSQERKRKERFKIVLYSEERRRQKPVSGSQK